ncbi:MAG: cytochrome c3 family protein [Actinomycetota bacterium]
MTKRIVGIGIILIAIYLAMGGVALAGYPHGEFADNTDACAACHRAHTAISQYLLAGSSGNALCTTCHWGGSGADTDVKNGVYNASGEPDNTWGEPGGRLLAGGFNFIGGTTPSTSIHILNTPIAPPGANTGATVTLDCTSCHTPHMNQANQNQYRLLRLKPNGVSQAVSIPWNGPWTDSSQTTPKVGNGGYRAYTEKDFDPTTPGIQYYTNNYKDNVDEWCIACHTRYKIRGDADNLAGDNYDAGDGQGLRPRYRHATDIKIQGEIDPFNLLSYQLITDLPLEDYNGDDGTGSTPAEKYTYRYTEDKMTCLTCHRSHGTDVVMTGFANFEDPENPARGERGTLPTNSMLLRLPNRGVCVSCHNMGTF